MSQIAKYQIHQAFDHTSSKIKHSNFNIQNSGILSQQSSFDFNQDITIEDLQIMFQEENIDPALQTLTKQLNEVFQQYNDKDNSVLFKRYMEKCIFVMSDSFTEWLNKGNNQNAEKLIQKCERLLETEQTTYGVFNNLRVLNLNNQAIFQRRNKDIAKALNYLDDALRLAYENNIKVYKGLTNLNMGVILAQIGDHEAAYESQTYAVTELYQDFFEQQKSIRQIQKRQSKMIQSSAHTSTVGPVSMETFYQVQQLLALALFNLGIEEQYYCNTEKAMHYFKQSSKIASENLNDDNFSQQILHYIKNYQDKMNLVEKERRRKNIKWNPMTASYRNKCISCVFNKKGYDVHETIDQYYDQYQQQSQPKQQNQNKNQSQNSLIQIQNQEEAREHQVLQRKLSDDSTGEQQSTQIIDEEDENQQNDITERSQNDKKQFNFNQTLGQPFNATGTSSLSLKNLKNSQTIKGYVNLYPPNQNQNNIQNQQQSLEHLENNQQSSKRFSQSQNQFFQSQNQQSSKSTLQRHNSQSPPQNFMVQQNENEIDYATSTKKFNFNKAQQVQLNKIYGNNMKNKPKPITLSRHQYSQSQISSKLQLETSVSSSNTIIRLPNLNQNKSQTTKNSNAQNLKFKSNFNNNFELLDTFQSQINTNIRAQPVIVKPEFFLNRRQNNKSLPNVQGVMRQQNKKENFLKFRQQQAKMIFKDKAAAEAEQCDCVLCKRIFGLPRNFITVYPYRNAMLKEILTEEELIEKELEELENSMDINQEDDDDDEDEDDSQVNSNEEEEYDQEGNLVKQQDINDQDDKTTQHGRSSMQTNNISSQQQVFKKSSLGKKSKKKKFNHKRSGKLCAGFEKQKEFLMISFKDEQDEAQDMDDQNNNKDYTHTSLHYIDFTKLLKQYNKKYNITSEQFLSTLHHICQQLRKKMHIDYKNKTVVLDIETDTEITIFKPNSQELWPAKFVKVDDQHSYLERTYAQTIQEFLEIKKKEIQDDKKNKILATDFIPNKINDQDGFFYAYIDRPNCNVIINWLVVSRGKFMKIKSSEYSHTVFFQKTTEILGAYQKSDDTKLVVNEIFNFLQSKLIVDSILGVLVFPDRQKKSSEINKTQVLEDYSFNYQTKITYESKSTDVIVYKNNFGKKHESAAIIIQKWWKKKFFKLKALLKIREELSKKYIFLFRDRKLIQGATLRLVIAETAVFPKKFFFTMEQLNRVTEDQRRINTYHELPKNLAIEIAEDENPWKFFKISFQQHTVDLAPQVLFTKKLEFYTYPFIVKIYRHFEPERTQLILLANKEINPDFDFKKSEYITPSIAKSIIKSTKTEDHFLVRPLKNEFRLVDPYIKYRSAIQIQRFVRAIFAKLKARQERQILIKKRKRAARSIQYYFKYTQWRNKFWNSRYIEYTVLKLTMKIKLNKILKNLKVTAKMVEKRKKAALNIWILYKYINWRAEWRKKWHEKRKNAATRIQIYQRYSVWRKQWYHEWMNKRMAKAAFRIQIYLKYKNWRRDWYKRYTTKRNNAATRIQIYYKYQKWQKAWFKQWKEKRARASSLLTSWYRFRYYKRKQASKKLSNWGKCMYVKIKTKKEIGWDNLKQQKKQNDAAKKIQKWFRHVRDKQNLLKVFALQKEQRERKKQEKSCIKIQMFLRRKYLLKKRASKRIQRMFRRFKSKRDGRKFREVIIKQIAAAKIIQNFIKKRQALKKWRQNRFNAILVIQYHSKKFVQRIREKRMDAMFMDSVKKIQRFYKKRYKFRNKMAIKITHFFKRITAKKLIHSKYNKKFNKLFYYIQSVMLPFIIENPDEEEQVNKKEEQIQKDNEQFEKELEISVDDPKQIENENNNEKKDIPDGDQIPSENNENKENQVATADVEGMDKSHGVVAVVEENQQQPQKQKKEPITIMKEHRFYFYIHNKRENGEDLIDDGKYQGGVESLQKPYFNTTMQKLSRCLSIFFAFKFYREGQKQPNLRIKEPGDYFEVDKNKQTGGISRKLKIYVAVIAIQKFFRVTLQQLLRKGIMCLPQENYQITQEVSNPLFIFTKYHGFTLSFSFMALKEKNHKKIFKFENIHGSRMQLGMNYDEEMTVVYRVKGQRRKMYSIRKIRYGLEYHCTIVYAYKQQENTYDLTFYINGTMEGCVSMSPDQQILLPNFIEYIGGDIYNDFVMTKPISKREVEDLFIERVYVLEYTWNCVGEKLPKRKKYLRGLCKQKQKSSKLVNNGGKRNTRKNVYPKNGQKSNLNDSFMSQMSQSSVNTVKLKERFEQQVRNVLSKNKFLLQLAKQMVANFDRICILGQILSPQISNSENLPFECLHTSLSNGKIQSKNTNGQYIIETDRLFNILLALNINTTIEDLQELGILTKLIHVFKDKDSQDRDIQISAIYYFKILTLLRNVLYPHKKKKQSVDIDEEEEQPKEVPDDWNYGAFEVGVIRCTRCNHHQHSAWHQEIEFVEKFNELGNILQSVFPKVQLVGNQIMPNKMEQFDVYLRACNPRNIEDISPHFIYKKNSLKMETFLKDFKSKMLKVYDQICFQMAQFMNFSVEMAEFQEMVINNNQDKLPHIFKGNHGHPHQLTEEETKKIEDRKRQSN